MAKAQCNCSSDGYCNGPCPDGQDCVNNACVPSTPTLMPGLQFHLAPGGYAAAPTVPAATATPVAAETSSNNWLWFGLAVAVMGGAGIALWMRK